MTSLFQKFRFPDRRALVICALLAGLAAIPSLVGGRYIPAVFTSILLFFILGALFDFMLGYLRIVNFGIAGFLCAGAYGSALSVQYFHITPWTGLLVGGLASAVIGLITGVLTLRLRGIYIGLTTLFVMETLRFAISNAREVTRGASGLTVGGFTPLFGIPFPRSEPITYYYLILALVIVTYAALYAIVRSRIGLVFKAIRDDELGTSVLGIHVVRYKLFNFVVASFFVGVFGAFYAHYIGILVPTAEEFGIQRTVEILTIAYVGGRGTLWGSLLGALFLVGMQEVLRDLQEWRLVIYGLSLILIITVFPSGFAGALRQLGDRFSSRAGKGAHISTKGDA
ncbi:branched-chain amino acid transport system permease protein [Angulomicrobium tetraedrale]|uniref:Branched-chain amino acid transport system permease protein n=1 Tax=Ancylobacter tetraedralis TaxID=217068 RepID=A0A839ZB58_9HYPH|nr:branched-chain amino acid ABC transporter permease [Ancylobacter tetraedralis]MBB3771932.1 branched-chain amino acid transport system permease protein [Ancylobacter tetraedralis]